MRTLVLPTARKDVFLATLLAYVCAPLAAMFFVLLCTWSPVPYPYFEEILFTSAQNDSPQAGIAPAGNTKTSSEAYAAIGTTENVARNADKVEVENEQLILASHHNEPFKQTTYLAPYGLLWKKWQPVENAIETEMRVISGCQQTPEKCPAGAATKFNDILSEALKVEGRARLGIVNRATNIAVRYTTDSRQYGADDYWATAFETLGSGKGDCEDYAIAKHAVLRAANWPADDLRIVVLWDSLLRDFHAVEAARHQGTWWILDNRTMTLVEDVNLAHYHPLFIIDDVSVRQLSRAAPAGGFRISDRLLTNAGDQIFPGGLCGNRSLAVQLVRMMTDDWLTRWGFKAADQ